MKHWVNNREPGTRIPELWLRFCSADYSGDTKTMVFKWLQTKHLRRAWS